MGWIKPTGNVANGWNDPTYAYDDNTSTSASYDVLGASWSPWLELTISEIECSNVRIWSNRESSNIANIQVDAYYNSQWNNIFDGTLDTVGEYVEYAIDPAQDVTAMRVRYYNTHPGQNRWAYVHEAEFYEELGGVSVSPSPASVVGNTQNPAVQHGSLSITPNVVSAVASTLIGAVVAGSLVLSPNPASAIGATIDPSVQIGGGVAVSPAPASAVALTIDPLVNGWYGSAWGYRTPFYIPSSKISSNISDFPHMLDLSLLCNCFWDNSKSDCTDIRITKDDGTTECPIHLVNIDKTNKVGVVWFKGDDSSTDDTHYYIYYGNPSASGYNQTDTYGQYNVYDSNRAGFYHCEEQTSDSVVHDATSGDIASVIHLYNAKQSAPVREGFQFVDADNDNVVMGAVSQYDFGAGVEFTIGFWFKHTETGNWKTFVYKMSGTGYYVETENDTTYGDGAAMSLVLNDGSGHGIKSDSGNQYNDGAWHMLQFRRNDSGLVEFFIDGVKQTDNESVSGDLTNVGSWRFGATSINCYMDEVYVDRIDRSDAWLQAEYYNQSDPDTFTIIQASEIGIGQKVACPLPAIAVGSVVNPSVQIGGGVSVSPSPASAISSTIDPSVIHGSVSVTPSATSALASAINPSVIHGSILISPSATSAVSSTIDPSVQIGDVVVSPSAVSAVGRTIAPSVIHGSIVITPASASAIGAVINPSVLHGSIIISPSEASAIGSTIDPNVQISDVIVSPSPTTAIASIVNPTIVHGSIIIAPNVASAIASTIDPSVQTGGDIVVSPSAVSCIASTISPTIIHGSISITPNIASAIGAVVDPSVIHGGLNLSPNPTSVVASTINPGVIHGALAVSPDVSSAVARTLAPSVVLGDTIASPSPATAVALTINPIVLIQESAGVRKVIRGKSLIYTTLYGKSEVFTTLYGKSLCATIIRGKSFIKWRSTT